jgi:hypothetical protein
MANSFDPSNVAAAFVLSNANHTATSNTGGNNSGYGTSDTFKSSGKLYFEYTNIQLQGSSTIGFAPAGNPLTSNSLTVGGVSESGSVSGGGSSNVGAPDGHTLCFAVDFTNSKYWVRIDGGSWAGSGSGAADPATNTNGVALSAILDFGPAPTPPFAPFVWFQNNPCHVTMNLGDSAFVQSLPSGFVAWDTTPIEEHTFATVVA